MLFTDVSRAEIDVLVEDRSSFSGKVRFKYDVKNEVMTNDLNHPLSQIALDVTQKSFSGPLGLESAAGIIFELDAGSVMEAMGGLMHSRRSA